MGIFKVAKRYCQILKQKKTAAELPTTEITGDVVDPDVAKAKAGLLQLTELQSAAGYLYNTKDLLKPLAISPEAVKSMMWAITQLYHTTNTLVSDATRAGLHDAVGYSHYIKSLITQLSQSLPEGEQSKINSVVEAFNKWKPENFDVLIETKPQEPISAKPTSDIGMRQPPF